MENHSTSQVNETDHLNINLTNLQLGLETSPAPAPAPAPAPMAITRPNSPNITARTTRGCGTHRSSQRRCNPRTKTETIPPPYVWSTDQRAVVHTLNHLRTDKILTIKGEVRCRRCQRQYEMNYDLDSKFEEIARFVEANKNSFYDRAPSSWMNPNYPKCTFCGLENGVRPVIPSECRNINWLFLLLGQMLGGLNLGHLKYFCNHTKNHRTGAKNRLLYLTYITLCHQLDPSGRFRRSN